MEQNLRTMDILQRYNMHVMGILEKERKGQRTIRSNNGLEFSKLMTPNHRSKKLREHQTGHTNKKMATPQSHDPAGPKPSPHPSSQTGGIEREWEGRRSQGQLNTHLWRSVLGAQTLIT